MSWFLIHMEAMVNADEATAIDTAVQTSTTPCWLLCQANMQGPQIDAGKIMQCHLQ